MDPSVLPRKQKNKCSSSSAPTKHTAFHTGMPTGLLLVFAPCCILTPALLANPYYASKQSKKSPRVSHQSHCQAPRAARISAAVFCPLVKVCRNPGLEQNLQLLQTHAGLFAGQRSESASVPNPHLSTLPEHEASRTNIPPKKGRPDPLQQPALGSTLFYPTNDHFLKPQARRLIPPCIAGLGGTNSYPLHPA